MGVIDNAVQWATDIANDDSHGYSQSVRWGPHYDCSSFVITAYQNAGVPVKDNGATSVSYTHLDVYKRQVYECVAEPDLHSKELQDAYGCTYPEEIVEKLFDAGEITPIAMECMKLAGYVNSVKLVEEVKN